MPSDGKTDGIGSCKPPPYPRMTAARITASIAPNGRYTKRRNERWPPWGAASVSTPRGRVRVTTSAGTGEWEPGEGEVASPRTTVFPPSPSRSPSPSRTTDKHRLETGVRHAAGRRDGRLAAITSNERRLETDRCTGHWPV